MFDAITTGRRTGRPIELYLFSFGPSNLDVRRYTDAEFPIVHAGETYSPIPIGRSIINNSGTLDKSAMEIALPVSLDIPQMFVAYAPAQPIEVAILQGEGDDPDTQFLPLWYGEVLSCARVGVEAQLACEPSTSVFSRIVMRRHYQYMCPHMLYGKRCKANKIAASSTQTVFSISGRTLTLTTLLTNPANYVAGSVEWNNLAGLLEARKVISVSEVSGRSVLHLTGPTRDLSATDPFTLILGCQHTEESCAAIHNNILNYGGMLWIPKQNPIGAVSPFQ